jgi:hypothetical protein
MTPFRQRETVQTELSALKALLLATPADPFATPMLSDRIKELESSLVALEKRPSLAPEAEIFFEDGPTMGSEGIEVTFTSHILDSYQNMLTNHYAAKHYGILRRSGRRRGEADTKLYLTALPRGSFGLQLARPHVHDWVAAQNLSAVMQEISGLIAASAKSDQAFDASLNTFNPRVLPPLQRFIDALFTTKASCRVVTGDQETKLDSHQVAEAYARVTAAKQREEIIDLPGVFGGVLTLSLEFEFRPDHGDLIRGPLADEITEHTATEWALRLTHTHTVATLKRLTVSTRSGDKKPSYELLGLKESGRLPAKASHPPKK